MPNPAKTEHPVLEPIAQRWSPRAFADTTVEPAKLRSLFEAARWAASSYNEQPWRFIVAARQDPAGFDRALGCLLDANQAWAKSAPVLVLTAVSTAFKKNGKPNRCAEHDLGAAAAHLALQAADLGLVVHQMAGINPSKVQALYGVPDGYEPQTAIAIGYPGKAADLPEDWMRAAEGAPRTRNTFDDFVFAGKWGEASGLF